ncbi:putative Ig domain-containing protein [Vibrio pelagius]|uniref:putative Ig domain-containing protein n=1 Tax=Vibrio pelagius TaxID=28169 RepID=UPI0021C4354D|nr:putative Ig domain-containing protein [Vibrio pelagius]
MKKVSLLAASVAFALTGCGGSDGDSSSATPSGVVITAIDGYLENAQVWVDTNNNFKWDSEDKQLDSNTDANGEITLPNEYKDNAIFIKAIAGQTIDKTRGLVTSNFDLAATAGATVVSPMTNMVVEQLAADDTLTQEDAENKVVTSVTNSGLTASQDLIFGDYIADRSEQAKALNAIGEKLVDNSGLAVDKQLELTDKVAGAAQTIIEKEESLEDFSPVVEVPTDGNPITVTPNSRPVDNKNGALESITLESSDVWVELNASAYFQDVENDTLTFELKELANDLNGLVIDSDTGIISGDLTKAGTYNYQIFAKDAHGALSYPLNLKVTKLADNLAPEIDTEEQNRLQSVINGWQLQEGELFNQTIDLAGLFNDTDGAIVKYRSGGLTIDGLTITPTEDTSSIVTISGTPSKSYPAGQTFNVGGVDDDNEPTYVTFTLPEVLKGTPVEPPVSELGFTQAHFDKGGVWQMGSFDYGDGEFAFASLRMEAGQHVLCWASEDDADSTISRKSWMETFDYQAAEYKANNGNVIGGDDCMPAKLNTDGTLEVEGDEPGSVTTISMVYQHITENNDYQIIMTLDEGNIVELFWLDSTEDSTGSIYNTFAYPSPSNRPEGDQYTEYLLIDDATAYNKIDPLLDQFDYTVTKTSGFDSETVLAEGTYRVSSVSFPDEGWSGNWVYEEVPPTGGLSYVGLPEFNEDVNRDILRRYFTYRDFGDVQIGVGDSDKDAQWGRDLNDFGFFFIASEDKEIIKSIHDAWIK